MTMKPTRNDCKPVVAFEVSKAQLVVHTLPDDQQVVITNHPKEISFFGRSRQQVDIWPYFRVSIS